MRNQARDKVSVVIFDFGGVLFTDAGLKKLAVRLARRHHVNPRAFAGFLIEEFNRAEVRPRDREFWKLVSSQLSSSPVELLHEILGMMRLHPAVLRIVHDVRAASLRTAMLSNQIASWHRFLMKKYRLYDDFDIIVTSYETQLAKPKTQIYRLLLRRLEVSPHRCVIIDDKKRNLVAPKNLGMATIWYRNARQCRRELVRVGVLIPH